MERPRYCYRSRREQIKTDQGSYSRLKKSSKRQVKFNCFLDVLMFVALMQRMVAEEKREKALEDKGCLYTPKLRPRSKSRGDAIDPFLRSMA